MRALADQRLTSWMEGTRMSCEVSVCVCVCEGMSIGVIKNDDDVKCCNR